MSNTYAMDGLGPKNTIAMFVLFLVATLSDLQSDE